MNILILISVLVDAAALLYTNAIINEKNFKINIYHVFFCTHISFSVLFPIQNRVGAFLWIKKGCGSENREL